MRICALLLSTALGCNLGHERPCTPTACEHQGKDCGTIPDGCGGRLDCGSCTPPEICGAGGANVCGPPACVPSSDVEICAIHGYECGSAGVVDDCGVSRTIACGDCPSGLACGVSRANHCDPSNCTPETDIAMCTRLGKNCGSLTAQDNCSASRTVSCGSCTGSDTCGGSGIANVCGTGGCSSETDAEMCARLQAECGTLVGADDCGTRRTIVCGVCEAPEMCAGDGVANQCGTSYPYRDVWNLKGIQPDDWPRDDLVANGIHGVPANLVWAQWEPSVDPAPCGGDKIEYAGRCFVRRSSDDELVRDWTARGVLVTAITFGVPAWASAARSPYCGPDAWGNGWFWAPDDDRVADFARFVGMLADRYDGTKGHGRIADFVIHNEVNAGVWFDVGRTHPDFDQQYWIDTYADNYIAAFDAVRLEQPAARVLMSFTHHYDERHDLPYDTSLARLSARSMIRGVAARAGTRDWRVAFHPYPHAPIPELDARDLNWYGTATYGSVGAMVGWLHAEFPDRPHAWQVQLTENGVASGPNSGADLGARLEKQKQLVCDALRNVLGTPGIDNHIYHRMVDHSMESGFLVGLVWGNNTPKPAWSTYANANRLTSLDCGYEDLPFTRLRQGSTAAGLFDLGETYWTSSRVLPNGYEIDANAGWRLLRDWEPGTRMLYECSTDEDSTLITTDPGCHGHVEMGPVGHAWVEPQPDSVPLYRCWVEDSFSSTHFVSTDSNCGGGTTEELLGYAMPPISN